MLPPDLALYAELARQPRLAALRGRFHSHLTVERPADLAPLAALCRGRRVKLTAIDLEDNAGRAEQTVMTTAYHRDAEAGAVSRILAGMADLGAILAREGFPVLRYKLEHEGLPTLERFDARCYREVHVKLRIPAAEYPLQREWLREAGAELGFVPSRNPLQQRPGWVVQFANMRRYDTDLAQIQREVDAVLARLAARGLVVAEVKQETAVLDTRRELDQWWA